MKESKFIELLNLYVDREISSEEAALLEAEIARNPERRKVYQQYCRMQKASVLLFNSFKSDQVPSGGKLVEAARNADEKIAHFPSGAGHRRTRWVYAGGLLAAAAAMAVVFVGRSRIENASPTAALKADSGRASVVALATPRATPSKALGAKAYQPALVARNFESQPLQAGAIFTSDPNQSLDWMKQMQLPPLRAVSNGDFVFTNKVDLKPDLRMAPLSKPTQGKVEMTAFQFQR